MFCWFSAGAMCAKVLSGPKAALGRKQMKAMQGRAAVASVGTVCTATTERGPPDLKRCEQNAHKLCRNELTSLVQQGSAMECALMEAPIKDRQARLGLAAMPGFRLPHKIKALYIATRHRTGKWLADALAADSAAEVAIEEAVGSLAGIARLREETFDVVLISHEPGLLDALDLVEGYRAGGAEEPIIVLGTQSEQEMAVLCYEVGADGYLCVHTATTRQLLWIVARAIQRHQLVRENQRLAQDQQARIQSEREEAERILRQQRAMIGHQGAAAGNRDGSAEKLPARLPPPRQLPQQLVSHYRDLLRTYVIMGTGNLSGELKQLADVLVSAGITPKELMHLHLYVLEELVRGLGTRSARHVMTRADLMVLELMLRLAEGYQTRYYQRIHPPSQQLLPGFAER